MNEKVRNTVLLKPNECPGPMGPGQRGFTILELVIAISILAIGLLGTATMLSTNMGADRFAQTVTVESAIASSAMEEILARPGTDAIFSANAANVAYDLDQDTAAATRTVQGRTYSAAYTIATNTPVTGVSQVSLTITSTGRVLTITAFKGTI